jgi:hypothetical protein
MRTVKENKPINFEQFGVPSVSDAEIEAACNRIAEYLPAPRRAGARGTDGLFRIVLLEARCRTPLYWMLCALLLAFGVYALRFSLWNLSPYAVLPLLSPLPFLSNIIDAFWGRERAVEDLEKTCRFSIRQLYLAKLLMGLACDLAVTAAVSLLCVGTSYEAWKLAFSSLTALFWAGTAALFLTGGRNCSLSVSALLAAWVIAGMLVLQIPEICRFAVDLNTAAAAGIAAVSAVPFFLKLCVRSGNNHPEPKGI